MIAAAARPEARFRLYAMQDDFVADERRYVCFIGGRNSGKTYAGSIKAFLHATGGGLGVIGAPDFPMLEHGAKRQFLDRLDGNGIDYRINRQMGMIYVYGWNAEILLATLETESRVRGPNFAWGWVDELDYLAQPTVWRALKGAVREGDNPQLFGTTTPKGRNGIVYGEWVIDADDQHALYKATTFDNLFIDATDYVSGLGYAGVFYDQEIGAEFVAFEGLVYPGFTRQAIRSLESAEWPVVLGLDVGTRNPTALLVCRYGSDRLHVEHEHYERGMSSDDITDLAVHAWQQYKPEYLVIDPSAAGLIASLQQRGIRVRKAVNDVLIGISTVTSTLPHMTVDPSCVNTIAEFESYRYPDGRRGNTDSPIKDNDHALDALRYVCMELFSKPQHEAYFA
jgi:phage terminase large subunit